MSPKVLLICVDSTVRSQRLRAFEEFGVRASTFPTTTAALAALDVDPSFDAIVVDCTKDASVHTGLLFTLSADYPKVRRILCLGRSRSPEIDSELARSPPHAVLSESWTKEEVLDAIHPLSRPAGPVVVPRAGLLPRQRNSKPLPPVLVVDDEPIVLGALKETISICGYTVVATNDPLRAVELLKQTEFFLVISDQRMPQMLGTEFLYVARRIQPRARRMLITAVLSLPTIIDAINLCEIDRFVAKPWIREELKAAVDVLRDKWISSAGASTISQSENNEYKEMYERLKGDVAASTEDVASLRAFAGITAHNLRGEFLNIGASVARIKDFTKGSAPTQEECDIISESANLCEILMGRLVDLLDMRRIMFRAVSANLTLRALARLASPRIPSTLELHVAMLPNDSLQYLGDEEQVLGILLELVKNSSKAMRDLGGTVSISCEESLGFVVFKVCDTGPGIDERAKEILFAGRVASKSGMGLGLHLSRLVIERLNGKLRLVSSTSAGTEIAVELPIAARKS